MKGNRFWLLILGALVLLSVVTLLIIKSMQTDGGEVAIYQNGELLQTLRLDEEQSLRIPAENGGYNLVVIQDGTVRVKEASCPDQSCVRHGPTKITKDPIVCLPNRLTVELLTQEEQPLDGVTG